MYQYIHLAIDLRTKYYHNCVLNVKSKLQRRTARRVKKKKNTNKYRKKYKNLKWCSYIKLRKTIDNTRTDSSRQIIHFFQKSFLISYMCWGRYLVGLIELVVDQETLLAGQVRYYTVSSQWL